MLARLPGPRLLKETIFKLFAAAGVEVGERHLVYQARSVAVFCVECLIERDCFSALEGPLGGISALEQPGRAKHLAKKREFQLCAAAGTGAPSIWIGGATLEAGL